MSDAVVPELIAEQAHRGHASGLSGIHSLLHQTLRRCLRVLGDQVAGLVEPCQARGGVGEQAHEAFELIAIGAGHLDDRIDARAAKLTRRDDVERREAATLVPSRTQAQCMQHLAFGHAWLPPTTG